MSTPALRQQSEVAEAHHDLIDRVEVRLLEVGGKTQAIGEVLEDFPVKHVFTPGLCSRTIFMPAGAVLTSKIHLTEHQYLVSKGRCLVMSEDKEWNEVAAPHLGITKPGTRRMLIILEDTVWTTFHATELTDPVEVEKAIVEDYENPLLATPALEREAS